MPQQQFKKEQAPKARRPFAGFKPLTSNAVYTPNQFFDVCLPYCSRGTVRLVAFLIRKTLGWCDENGNPQTERHAVSWREFEAAGINHDMIKTSLAEAIQYNFIRCIRAPQPKRSGQPAISGLYELKWDERPGYIKDPADFRGFFAGEGNRTYIPNQFFDEVVPQEPLAVLKVVGSIIRFSVGFQNKWGHRRRNVSLSYQHIQNYSLLRDRKTLSGAIRHALKWGYIERVEEGFFDPNAGKLSKAAVYAIKWLNQSVDDKIGRKTLPEEIAAENRSENPTGIGRKSPPEDRSEIPTDIEIKQRNKTLKQQATVSFGKLKAEGFDEQAAQAIASKYSPERIERQIRWIDARNVKLNRLGMLRSAIERDWPAPAMRRRRQTDQDESLGESNLATALTDIERRLFGDSHHS
jgi:hypothetical protein